MIDLYEPTDIDAAHAEWKANCGPCSLAAILQKEVGDVRQFLNGFDKRGYMNPTHMKEALHLAGHHFTIKKTIPIFGLAFIQFTGTWTKSGAPIAAAYRHTHWVGVAHPKPFWTFLYDVNIEGGQWVEKMWWEENVLPMITEAHKGADGKYFIRTAIEVEESNETVPRAKRFIEDNGFDISELTTDEQIVERAKQLGMF